VLLIRAGRTEAQVTARGMARPAPRAPRAAGYTRRMAVPLKEQFFQRPFLERLADAIREVHPAFPRARFLRLVFDARWPGLELKDRMHQAADALGRTLPGDYRAALRILLAVEGRFSGFDHMLFADFVERFGTGDPEASLAALERFTRSSAEFAIRPFLEQDPEATLARMLAWSASPDENLRRLASEGCRPRLPWGRRLPALQRDPAPILPILERLLDDPSAYVRRSVANNLGDVAKDHLDLALDLAERWLAEAPARAPLLKHALRGPLKAGNRRAMALFGYGEQPRMEVLALEVRPHEVPLGGRAELRLALRSKGRRAQTVRLEYELSYARPAGRTARKVFRIAESALAPGAEVELVRRLDFRDRATRKHHRGAHELTLCVNGARVRTVRFALT